MDKKQAIEKAKAFADLVIETLNPMDIILFGSFAKDKWTDDSDIDIAVVFEKIDGNSLELSKNLFKLRRHIDPVLEPLVFDNRYDPSGFLEQIRKEGIRIYPY